MTVQQVQELLVDLTATEQLEIARWLIDVALSKPTPVQPPSSQVSSSTPKINGGNTVEPRQQNGLADADANREREIFDRELEAFESIHAHLFERMPGQFAAIHQGQLIDHDEDQFTLYIRLQEKYGDEPVLIKQVQPTPQQDIVVRSPRFEHG